MLGFMSSSRKKLALLAVAALGSVATQAGAVTFTVDPAATYSGFVNVFNLPAPLDNGAYIYSQPWGASDIPGTFNGNVLTLTGNTSLARDLNPTPVTFDTFWFRLDGGGNVQGNKVFDGSFYVENNTLGGSPVTFTANVLSNTLAPGYSAVAFIRVFDGAFNLLDSINAPLTPGVFSISRNPVADTIVQYGINITGPVLPSTNAGPSGSVRLAPAGVVPEPAAASLMLLGLPVLARRNRRG